jgi:hypothetical protein
VALDRETLESMERELATLVHTLAGPGAKPDPGSR